MGFLQALTKQQKKKGSTTNSSSSSSSSRSVARVKVCYKQLRKQLEGRLLDFDARGVASLLHATAKLGCVDPYLRAQGLLGDLLHVSAGLMEEFSPMQLAMLAHAVARAEPWSLAKPSRRWWAEFFLASQAAMQQELQLQPQQRKRRRRQQDMTAAAEAAPQQEEQQLQGAQAAAAATAAPTAAAGQAVEHFTTQGYANMVWAMGKLSRRPGADWASVLYLVTEPQLAGFSAQGLANLGYGLASMHADGGLPRPGSSWIGAYLTAACAQLEGFSSQGMANLLWSLAKLGYCPSREQLGSIAAASQSLLPSASPQDLSLSVYSFAVLAVKLPEAWWGGFWASSGRCMEAAGSQALANMLWAHARLRKVPPSQWLLAFLPCLQQQLPRCSPQATSTVLWAAAQLKLQQLPGAWLDSILARVYQQLLDGGCGPQELSLVLEALQQLQHRPSSKWLDRFYAASQPRLPFFSSKQLATTLAALGGLSPDATPPAAWSAAALAAVSARIATLSAPGLCEVVWGLCELRLVPGPELVQRYMAQTAEKMHLMNGAMLSRTLRTLVRFGHAPNADWLALLADESLYYLGSMSPEQMADIVWGFGQQLAAGGLSTAAATEALAAATAAAAAAAAAGSSARAVQSSTAPGLVQPQQRQQQVLDSWL
ncbi:hypothetical protein COO60DRAFT_1636811 [Scenedesmus sp. NREL 46B-D3]|nr:hypothetical protein COO60DRAFT_1636811 [Scenedesmus sp. NREL 46B-D3]